MPRDVWPDRTVGGWARPVLLTLALMVPALALAAAPSPLVGAQGYPSPTIIVNSFQCPSDTDYGDHLAEVCAEPRTGLDFSLDGPASVTDTSDGDGSVQFDELEPGDYTVTDETFIGEDTSLAECRATQGFGSYLNLPVEYGDAGELITVDLTNTSARVGLATICTWYVIPASAGFTEAAGLSIDAGTTTDPDQIGFPTIPADGTGTPLSGAGPVLPVSGTDGVFEYTVEGSGLDGPLDYQSDPDAESFTGSVGPIVLPPGDYTVADITRGLEATPTLTAGGVTHLVSIALDEETEEPAPGTPAEINFLGESLAGAYTDLDVDLYGTEPGALYGADSGSSTGTFTFGATAFDLTSESTLTLLGLDDELPASASIVITVNGTDVYAGESGFPAWDPDATGLQWAERTFTIPPGALLETGNELTITNQSPGDSVGEPPWVMIATGTLTQ